MTGFHDGNFSRANIFLLLNHNIAKSTYIIAIIAIICRKQNRDMMTATKLYKSPRSKRRSKTTQKALTKCESFKSMHPIFQFSPILVSAYIKICLALSRRTSRSA